MLVEQANIDHLDMQEGTRRWGLNRADGRKAARGLGHVIQDLLLGVGNPDYLPQQPHYRKKLLDSQDSKWHHIRECSRWPTGTHVIISWSRPGEEDALCSECAELEENQP